MANQRGSTMSDNSQNFTNSKSWDFQATELTVYFNELPIDEEITIVLTDWYNDLKDEPAGRQPVKVKGYFKHQVKTIEGRIIPAQQGVIFVFWHGIYDKWLNAPKNNLNVSNRLELTLMKFGKKSWRILTIQGV